MAQKNNNEVHEMYLAREAEGFFNVPIEEHLWRDEIQGISQIKSWDRFNCILNLLVEEDIKKTNPSIKIKE